jgi:hypothetical protein
MAALRIMLRLVDTPPDRIERLVRFTASCAKCVLPLSRRTFVKCS